MAPPFPVLDWPNPRLKRSVVAQTAQPLGPTQPISTLPPFYYLDWPRPQNYTQRFRAGSQIALSAQQLGPTRPLPSIARAATIAPVPHNDAGGSRQLWLTQIARNWNLMLGGKMNATTSIVLNPGQGTTVLKDSRIGPFSHIALTPLSTSAASVLAGLVWFEPTQGSVTIHHPVTADFDASCSVLIVG